MYFSAHFFAFQAQVFCDRKSECDKTLEPKTFKAQMFWKPGTV